MLLRRNERAASRWAVLVYFGVTACALDERVLKQGGAAGAGTSGNSGGSTGATAGSGVESDAGNADAPGPGPNGASGSSPLPPLVDGCADLDSDGVADCKVTLLKNSSFETDVAGWIGVDGAVLTWDPDNALADTPSGCARLRPDDGVNADALIYQASQCVAVPAGQLIIAYANARVDEAPAGAQMLHALLQVTNFDSPDCSGKSSDNFATPPSEGSDNWVTIQAGGPQPSRSSVSVALVGIRPDPTSQPSVCFDNVMVKTTPLP